MTQTTINIHAAKTQLSQLIKRAERGERITIARDGKPVAQLGPPPRRKPVTLSPDDPLLNLDTFAVDGAGENLTNADIDQILYGKP